jgi:hypothetical protein
VPSDPVNIGDTYWFLVQPYICGSSSSIFPGTIQIALPDLTAQATNDETICLPPWSLRTRRVRAQRTQEMPDWIKARKSFFRKGEKGQFGVPWMTTCLEKMGHFGKCGLSGDAIDVWRNKIQLQITIDTLED